MPVPTSDSLHVATRPEGVAGSVVSIGPNPRALAVYLVVFQHVPRGTVPAADRGHDRCCGCGSTRRQPMRRSALPPSCVTGSRTRREVSLERLDEPRAGPVRAAVVIDLCAHSSLPPLAAVADKARGRVVGPSGRSRMDHHRRGIGELVRRCPVGGRDAQPLVMATADRLHHRPAPKQAVGGRREAGGHAQRLVGGHSSPDSQFTRTD